MFFVLKMSSAYDFCCIYKCTLDLKLIMEAHTIVCNIGLQST